MSDLDVFQYLPHLHAANTQAPGRTLRVVSLATGNKCVGKGKISKDGSVVHDSHAEVGRASLPTAGIPVRRR